MNFIPEITRGYETREYQDGTVITFFPVISYARIDRSGLPARWITAYSMDSAEATYYMDMDSEVMYG